MLKSHAARIARLPISDMAASLVNGEAMSGKNHKTTIADILDFAAKTTKNSEEMEELLEQSRVIVWNFSDPQGNTIIHRAAGMSVPDDELLTDMRSRILAKYPAFDDHHIQLHPDESELSLGEYILSVKNVSASQIISQNSV